MRTLGRWVRVGPSASPDYVADLEQTGASETVVMAAKGYVWRTEGRLRWWWRRRPVRVSVWELANARRWADQRSFLLDERGLTEEEANDVRVP